MTLTAAYRVSRRGVSELARDLFGARLSVGTIDAICQRASEALAGPHLQLADWVPDQDAVHVDETGWRTRGAGRALWTATTPQAVFLEIAEHCNREQFNALIGTSYPGIVISDRWNGYSHLDPTRRQACWSHIKRDFAAPLRIVIDDLVDLILRPQLTTGTLVPRLTASLTLLALPAHQLLRLRTRFRTPLRPRLRWIHRRRPRAHARVLTCLLLQSLQPILMLRKPGREIKDELNTRLTPRVINRLRLRAIHAPKIRCTNKEPLPLAPTAERLLTPAHLQAILQVRPDGK